LRKIQENIIQVQYALVLLKDLLQYNYLDVLDNLERIQQKKKKFKQKQKTRKDLLHKNMDKMVHDYIEKPYLRDY